MTTTVISVRGQDRDALLADPTFVYVGRECYGWPRSVWGNPFRVGDLAQGHLYSATATEAIGKYHRWLTDQLKHTPRPYDLASLRGKRLGCWCGNSDCPAKASFPCHAVVLALMADGLPVPLYPDNHLYGQPCGCVVCQPDEAIAEGQL